MNAFVLLIAVILFTLIGSGFGIITGLIPGIHVNNIALLVLALQASLVSFALGFLEAWEPSNFDIAIIITSLIIGCLITHTFLDIIPSVFLGAPEEDTALSVLPGHRLMLAGRGYEAIKCSALGSFGSVLVALIVLFPARLLMGSPVYAYEKLLPFIPFILISIVTLLILSERGELPDLSGKKRPRLRVLKISVKELSGPDSKDDKTSASGENVISIKETPDHLEEEVCIRGVVTRIANNTVFFIEDETAEILLSGGKTSDIEVGEELVCRGKVECRVTWIANLKQKLFALCLFLLAGFYGLIVLGAPGLTTHNWYPIPALNISPSTTLLFPLFTGLFGLSTLSLSLIDTPTIPEQEIKGVRINLARWRKVRGVCSGTFAGGLVGWYPGVTSAQATVLAKSLAGGDVSDESKSYKHGDLSSQKEFIVAYSGVNTSNAVCIVISFSQTIYIRG